MSRSPHYPAVGLKAAVVNVRKLFDKYERRPATNLEAVGALGYSSLHGIALSNLSALKKFGLLEAPKTKTVKVSELAIRVVLNEEGSQEHREALKEAALSPRLFHEVYERHKDEGGLPSEGVLERFLVMERGFTQKGASKATDSILETFELVDLFDKGYIDAEEEEQITPQEEMPPMLDNSTTPQSQATLPAISFPLPGGNSAEIRLQKRLSQGDFKKFTDLVAAMEWCFVETDPERSDQG